MGLLILCQVSKEDLYQFKNEVKTYILETREALEKQIEQFRIEMRREIDNVRSETNSKMNLLAGLVAVLIGFVIGFGLWDRRTYLKPVEEKKADKEYVLKLESKVVELTNENEKLKQKVDILADVLEKVINYVKNSHMWRA